MKKNTNTTLSSGLIGLIEFLEQRKALCAVGASLLTATWTSKILFFDGITSLNFFLNTPFSDKHFTYKIIISVFLSLFSLLWDKVHVVLQPNVLSAILTAILGRVTSWLMAQPPPPFRTGSKLGSLWFPFPSCCCLIIHLLVISSPLMGGGQVWNWESKTLFLNQDGPKTNASSLQAILVTSLLLSNMLMALLPQYRSSLSCMSH